MSGVEAAIAAWWTGVTWAEVLGTVTGLLCVWLYGRESLWAWPLAIVNALAFMVTFFEARLYADVVLQVVFFTLSVIGWYKWLRGGPEKSRLEISRGLPARRGLALVGSVAAISAGSGYYFAHNTNAALPYWDATILGLSLGAQWLLNRKQLENWYVWILVDVIAVGVYAYRGLVLTSMLYAVFFGLAVRGAVSWNCAARRAERAERLAAA